MVTLIIYGLETVEELAGILKFGIKEKEYFISCDKDTIHFIRKGLKMENSGNNEVENKKNSKYKKGLFSTKETQFIIENYGELPIKKIAEHLNRNPKSVADKIWWLRKAGKINKKIKNSGRNPKYLCTNNYDCSNCKYGIKEEVDDTYWCEKLKKRVFPQEAEAVRRLIDENGK